MAGLPQKTVRRKFTWKDLPLVVVDALSLLVGRAGPLRDGVGVARELAELALRILGPGLLLGEGLGIVGRLEHPLDAVVGNPGKAVRQHVHDGESDIHLIPAVERLLGQGNVRVAEDQQLGAPCLLPGSADKCRALLDLKVCRDPGSILFHALFFGHCKL